MDAVTCIVTYIHSIDNVVIVQYMCLRLSVALGVFVLIIYGHIHYEMCVRAQKHQSCSNGWRRRRTAGVTQTGGQSLSHRQAETEPHPHKLVTVALSGLREG